MREPASSRAAWIVSIMSVRVAGEEGSTAAHRDRKSQNPESGIQTKPDKHKWPSFYPDIRTQNPESGIRNPDPSSPHEPACMEGHQNPESRIRNPESRPQQPSLTHEPACMEGHQNPEPRIRNPETSLQNLCERPREIRTKKPDPRNGIWIFNSGFSHLLEGSV